MASEKFSVFVSGLTQETLPDYLVGIKGGVSVKYVPYDLPNVFVDQEIPSGVKNSSNTIFTLANTPIAGSVYVYLNGLLCENTIDYTIASATITFTIAPDPSDSILTSYRK